MPNPPETPPEGGWAPSPWPEAPGGNTPPRPSTPSAPPQAPRVAPQAPPVTPPPTTMAPPPATPPPPPPPPPQPPAYVAPPQPPAGPGGYQLLEPQPWWPDQGAGGAWNPAQGPLPPLPAPAHPRRKRRILVATIVILLAAGGGTAAWMLTRSHGPSYPKAWDPRIEPLAKEASRLRKLDYKRPVYVEFLTPQEYTKKTTGGDDVGDGASDENAAELADAVAQYRAVGLLEGKVDLAEAGKTLADSGTLAFYDPSDKRVYIRGTELTVDLKVTLVHELVHVLQDQNFDLSKVQKKVQDEDGDSLALRALVEGDASEVEDRYVDGLSKADRADYDKAQAAQSDDEGTKKVLDLPPVLLQIFGAPYTFGPRFVSILKESGGQKAVDLAYTDPPSTFAQIWNPFVYLDQQQAVKVKAPTLPKGAELLDDSPAGSFVMYLILAQRTDPLEALAAADAWRGDSTLAYKQDGKVCVDIRVRGDDSKAMNTLGKAWTDWQAAMPEGIAKVGKLGTDGVSIHACDPGEAADLHPKGSVDELLAYPVGRLEVATEMMTASNDGNTVMKIGPAAAYCYADRVIRQVPIGALNGDLAGWQPDPQLQGRLQNDLRTCVREHP